MSVQPQLNQLEDAGLVQLATADPELAYLFRHGLIQDATYSTLLRGQRRAWHAVTAEVLESICRTPADTIAAAPILARHFSLAGERPRALYYLLLAGDAAFEHFANEESAEFYRQALEIIAGPDMPYEPAQARHLFGRYGRALELTSRFEAALANYQTMERTGQQRGDLALELAAVMARATIYSTANLAQDLPQAERLLERASGLAHQAGDSAAEANINWTLMLTNAMAGGDPETTARRGQRALETARASNQPNLVALVLTDLWFGRATKGQWALAREGLVEACDIAQGLGNLTVVAESRLRISMTDMFTGDYQRSLAEMVKATDTAEALNSNDMRSLTRLTAGLIYADRGEYDQAIAYSEEAVRLGEQTNNVTVLIGTRAELGQAYAFLGDSERGEALALKAQVDGGRFPIIAGWAGSAVARLALLRGDLAQAEAEIARYPDYRELMDRVGFVPMMWIGMGLAVAELALLRGDPARALAETTEMLGHIEHTGVTYARAEVGLMQGRALAALNRLEEAWMALETARREAERLSARRVLLPILSAQAELAQARGAPDAGALRRQARALVDYIAAHTPTPELRQRFLQKSDVLPLLNTND